MKPPNKTSFGPLAALATVNDQAAAEATDPREKAYREKSADKLREMSQQTVH